MQMDKVIFSYMALHSLNKFEICIQNHLKHENLPFGIAQTFSMIAIDVILQNTKRNGPVGPSLHMNRPQEYL